MRVYGATYDSVYGEVYGEFLIPTGSGSIVAIATLSGEAFTGVRQPIFFGNVEVSTIKATLRINS